MAKALKYFFEFSDIDADDYKVEIWVEGFAGTAIELIAGGNPLTRSYNKDVGEKYLGGIVPSVISIEAISNASFHAVDFTGQNYGDAVAVVYKNTVLQYNAIIVPFEGSDSDLNDGIYSVNLSAECGLVNLKTITFLPSGTRKKLLDVIIQCINNIPYVNSFGYSVVDNVDLRDADLNKPYYYESFIEDKFFEGLSCYDVINSIIQQYGQFTFTDGRWDIKNIAEISKVNSVKRTYSNAGVLQASTTYTRPDESVTRTAGGDFGLMFSQKSVTIEKSKSMSRSLNPNSGFDNPSGWTFEGIAPLLFEITNGYLTNKGNTWFTEPSNLLDSSYVQSPATTYFPFKSSFEITPKQQVKIKFKSTKGGFIKNLRLQIIAVQDLDANFYYLTNEGSWYRAIAGINTPIYAADFKDNVEEVITIPQVPFLLPDTPPVLSNVIPVYGEFMPFPYLNAISDLPYKIYVRVFMPERLGDDFPAGIPIVDLTTQIDYINITVEDVNNDALNGFTKKFGVVSPKDRNGDLTIKLGVGYPSFPVAYDSLFFNGSTTNPIITYNALPIEEFIAESYLSVLSQRQKFYQGTVIGDIEFGDLLDIDGEKHRIHNYEYNYKLKQANIKTIGLGVNADTIEELPVYDSDVNLDIDSILNQVDIDMNRKYGDNLNLKFVDKNIQINTLADGQKSLSLRQDFRISRLYSTDVFLRTASDGSIQDVAEDTEGNFTLIKPAKDGTYALLEDIEDLAWLQEGNTATVATKKLGTLDNFDFNIIRNNVNIGQIKSTGLDLLDNRLDVGAVQFNVATAQTVGVAKTIWNDTFGTLEFGLKGGNVNYRLGQSSIVYVKSADNAGLTKGTVVYTAGSDGTNKTVRLAQANAESTSSKTFGIIAETVTGGEKSFCTTFGNIEGINTSAFAEGATIYLSPTVAGGMTTTKPSAPNHMVVVGFCLRSHATLGVIFVKVQNGFELDEIHNVAIGTLANNNLLAYEASTSLWKNKTYAELGLSSGTGTTNFVTKWSNATGGLTNSLIFDNGTNVGINNVLPTYNLDITGTLHSTGNAIFDNNVGIGSISPATKLHVVGQVSASLGSLANPSYSFIGDLNTGLYSPSADALALVTNGVNRLNISSGGDVNIGSGAGTNSLIVNKSITGGTEVSGIRSSGQLQSDVTTSGFFFRAVINQSNYVITSIIGYESQVGTISGTGTNLINFRANANNAGFTNVYGFQSTIASGTNRWNVFMSGTAQNHFRGNVGIGAGSTVPTTELDVLGITRTTNLRITNGAAVGKVWQCNNVNGSGEWVTPLSSERYIGEWAANSGVAPSASPTTGDYYVVNTAGTYLGITYAAGDEIYWNGTAWLKRSNFLTLPIATASVLGGIKIGTGLSIDGSGVVSVASSPILTTAITISATGDGTWSVNFNGSADVSGALTLATITNSASGTFLKITRNEKGLVTGTQAVVQADITGLLGAASITNTMLTDSGVALGTYRSVTVNAKGIVTGGTNPTTVSGYGITDFYSQIVSGFVTGENSTVLNTDSLEVALEKLQGQINARISGNQTITLGGIVTGSGTTAITTSIADAALSIAKTSGLQTALDGKFATPTGLTTNFVSKWGGSAFANSQIFDNGTNVGIGTSNPTFKVDIVNSIGIILRHSETANTSGAFRLIGGNYSGNGVTGLIFGANINNNSIQYGGGTGFAEPATQHQFYVGTYGTKAVGREVMRIANTGFVGINTTNPAYTFDVEGTIRTASILISTGATVGSFLKCNNVNGTSVWSTITTSDISNLSSWAGSTSITTLGTITTGTWNGSTIATTRGGTGLTAIGTANQLLRVNAGATALEYFTPTFISGNQTITITGDATGSGTTSIALTLANSGVTANTYRSVTVNSKGLVTAGTNPTTISGYGITDAYTKTESDARYQGLDADLTAIGALTGTNGILRKTAANTWSLDTNTFVHSGNLIDFRATTTQLGFVAVGTTMEINGFGVINQKSGLVTANTYRSVTVDTYGRVTSGTNPTTLAGYAITDAYTKTESDGRFVALAGSYANPTWITSLAWSKLSGVPATFAPSAHTHAASDITSGVIATARLASGTASATTYLRGDQTWATLPTGGITALTGDVTASGSGSVAATLATVTQANTGDFRKITIDTKGRVTGNTAVVVSDLTALLGTTRYLPYNTGVANFVTKWSNTSGGISNSQIFDNGTNIGIGNSVPDTKLHLSGNFKIDGGTGYMLLGNVGGNYWIDVPNTNLNLYGTTVVSKNNHNFEFKIALGGNYGTAGQVLTSQGSGANPTWTTVSGGSVGTIDQVLAAGNTAVNKTLIMTNNSTSNIDVIRINGVDGYDRNIFFSEVGGTDFGAFVGFRAGVSGGADPTMLTMLTVQNNITMGGIAIHRQNGHVYVGSTPNDYFHSSVQIANNKLFVDGNMRVGGNEIIISGSSFKLSYSDFFAGAYTPAMGDKIILTYNADKNAFVMQKIQVYTNPFDSRNYLIL